MSPQIAGIDVSTFAVDVVVLPLDPLEDESPRHQRIQLRPKAASGHEAMWIAARSGGQSIARSPIWTHVALAYVERGFGRDKDASYKLGIITGVIAASVPLHVRLRPVRVQEWKIELLGKGNGNCLSAVYVSRLVQMGYEMPDENAYAALGIALAMRSLHESGGR